MPFDILTVGEAPVEIMRTGIDQPHTASQEVVQYMVGALDDFPETWSS